MDELEREARVVKYRRYLDKPHTDPWNWVIIIGVLVFFLGVVVWGGLS